MKLSLITLHYVKNYGSVLQTYATQEYLKNAGIDVEVIDYRRHDLQDPYYYVKQAISEQKQNHKPFIIRWAYKSLADLVVRKKVKVFGEFLNKYIKLTDKTYLTEDELVKADFNSDVYCVGSDQMWNSICNHGFEKPFFLNFVPDDKKKIAFSSSFGKSNLEEDEIDITRQYLNRFNAISVREESGLKILQKLDIKNGVHILDPTLLLTKDQWHCFINKNLVPKKPYLLIYELGKNDLLNDCANMIAKQKNLKIIRIGIGFSQITRKNTRIFPQVETWLSLFRYADYIITDSFHGTAFSINFNKQFQVVYPKKFSTRLESILSLCNLCDRVITSTKNISVSEKIIDYKEINAILKSERNKAKEFVCNALDLERNKCEKNSKYSIL